jgi:hypothetical protein
MESLVDGWWFNEIHYARDVIEEFSPWWLVEEGMLGEEEVVVEGVVEVVVEIVVEAMGR